MLTHPGFVVRVKNRSSLEILEVVKLKLLRILFSKPFSPNQPLCLKVLVGVALCFLQFIFSYHFYISHTLSLDQTCFIISSACFLTLCRLSICCLTSCFPLSFKFYFFLPRDIL